MYRLELFTNNYVFLLRFAYETGALIQVLDSSDDLNHFTLNYNDLLSFNTAQKYIDELVKKERLDVWKDVYR